MNIKLMAHRLQVLQKWLTPGLGIKRWVLLLAFGITVISLAIAELLVNLYRDQAFPGIFYVLLLNFLPPLVRVIIGFIIGGGALSIAILALNRSILAPYVREQRGPLIDMMVKHNRRNRGIKVVALGGGTGLPAVLRGFRGTTSNITAIVTVADDGGSSGKLRREQGVLPPGDLRNNLAALANDENLMTQLFQYRFRGGGLDGHSFGNLFLTALVDITGSMDQAVLEAGRVLAIQGRVLPATLQDITLVADVRSRDGQHVSHVRGESQIPLSGGVIERVSVDQPGVRAYPESIRAILAADLIVIGPGSLYTSIIPTLLAGGIPEAIRANSGTLRVYICNIAMQTGETEDFSVADHVLALERHIGRGVFDAVLANNAYPTLNAGITRYVLPTPADHELRKRYEFYETDLTETQFPWRHSPAKLNKALLDILAQRQGATNLPVPG